MTEPSVKLIRLRHTPEEIIATVTGETTTHMGIEKPFIPITSPDGARMGLHPWMMLSKNKEFKIDKKDILVVSDPLDSLRDGYLDHIAVVKPVRADKNLILPA